MSSWAGLRPATPDGLPLIGEIAPGVVVASGHGMLGVTLAPATAALVAPLVLEGRAGPELAPFAPAPLARGDRAGRPAPHRAEAVEPASGDDAGRAAVRREGERRARVGAGGDAVRQRQHPDGVADPVEPRQTRCEIHFALRSRNESGRATHSHIATRRRSATAASPSPTSIGRLTFA